MSKEKAMTSVGEVSRTIDFELYANLRHQYDEVMAELERTRDERNRAGKLVRGEYVLKIRALKAEVRALRAKAGN